MRTLCSLCGAGKAADYFKFDWKSQRWNLVVVLGVIVGGFLGSNYLSSTSSIAIHPDVVLELNQLGFSDAGNAYLPEKLFDASALQDFKSFGLLAIAGLLVGFGTRYASGCTSGHAISGLSNLQLPSLICGHRIFHWRPDHDSLYLSPNFLSMRTLIYFFIGIFFGIILIKSEAASWFRIYEMFQFKSFHMYGIIGSAVGVGIVVIQLIKRMGIKSFGGKEINLSPKEKGISRYLIGGTIFGLGWALAGACPGPMFALAGAGYLPIIIVIISAVLGTFLYGVLKNRLPH